MPTNLILANALVQSSGKGNKMPAYGDQDSQKRIAAAEAVAEITPGIIVGLGAGTTSTFAISAIAVLIARGIEIHSVATSVATEAAARLAGIPMIDFSKIDIIDLCIDGVDEIDPQLRAIKGAGGAMLREKIVASAARRMIAIADASKRVERIGGKPVPLEVLPYAEAFVLKEVRAAGAIATVRCDDYGNALRTDQSTVIVDCSFGPILDPAALSTHLAEIAGVLGHGLFLDQIDALYLGTPTGVVRHERLQL